MVIYVKTITGENVAHENVSAFNIGVTTIVINYAEGECDDDYRLLEATYYKANIIGYCIDKE
jgi:hypothetical protein